MEAQTKPMIRFVCSTIAVVALLAASAGTTLADALIADGDGVAPLSGTRMDFGRICHGQPVSLDALVAVRATGHPNNKQVFENGTPVVLSASVVNGQGLAVAAVDPVIVMAPDWRTQPNNSFSDPVAFAVTLVPVGLGSFTGKIAVTADGTNRFGEAISRTDNLTVRARVDDCAGPVFEAADDLVAEAVGPDGAEVAFDWPTAVDAVDGQVPSTCDLASPAALSLGTTIVTCGAMDEAGNPGSAEFSITVQDTTPPVLDFELADQEVPGDAQGAVVTWESPTAVDAVDGEVEVGCDPASGSLFSDGTTVVSCQAADAEGNVAELTFSVTVLGPASDPDADEVGPTAPAADGPVQDSLPDTAMNQPALPLAPLGLALLAAASLVFVDRCRLTLD
jgi:hypothetical protein